MSAVHWIGTTSGASTRTRQGRLGRCRRDGMDGQAADLDRSSRLSIVFDAFEDVGVGFLLPLGQDARDLVDGIQQV